MDIKENKVILRRAELKNMIKELIKEMVANGELASVFNAGAIPGTVQNQAQGKYGLDPNVTSHIATLASAVAGNDPAKKNVLEAIFADTAKVTNPQQMSMEMNQRQPFFGQGTGHPAFTAVANNGNQQIGYTGNEMSYPVQAPPQGYIPYGTGIPQQTQAPQQQMHPLAKIAFKHPLKNTLDNS